MKSQIIKLIAQLKQSRTKSFVMNHSELDINKGFSISDIIENRPLNAAQLELVSSSEYLNLFQDLTPRERSDLSTENLVCSFLNLKLQQIELDARKESAMSAARSSVGMQKTVKAVSKNKL